MRRILTSIHNFFFEHTSARGFAFMRIGFGLVTIIYGLGRLPNVTRYFSTAGLVTDELAPRLLRDHYHYTLLSWFSEPSAVLALYCLFLAAAFCMVIGFRPRIATIIATILLFSFHERNPLILGGGDTVLRNVAFLLCLAPVGKAFSFARIRMQLASFRNTKELLPPVTTERWPVILLTWQLIVIYGTSAWDKLLGTMWIKGTAVASALHHLDFARFPREWMDAIAPLSPAISYGTITFELLWLLLLFPARMLEAVGLARGRVKRALLVAGVAFHGGIFILMDVGSFSMAMFVAYLGLLNEEDFEAARKLWNRRFAKKFSSIAILYDGHCGLCRRSIFWLQLLDFLHRLRPIDFHDAKLRKEIAPDLSFAKLDKALHIRFIPLSFVRCPKSCVRSPKSKVLRPTSYPGFSAFRKLSWSLPLLLPLAPFLYYPGISHLGDYVYRQIAARRKKCTHENCSF